MTDYRQYLIFSNPGEIDPRLITTLGVNVKTSTDSPIGFFGTGLKYALATTLRLGCQLTVQSGLRQFRFQTRRETLRGKDFEFIEMVEFNDVLTSTLPLGFTTELGRQWAPWMAYREFECNCMDEQGKTEIAWAMPEAQEGLTRFILLGEALVREHFERGKWLLQSKPLYTHPMVEFHPARLDRAVFYRGIKVAESDKSMAFTYNFTEHMDLTEDRTLRGLWNTYSYVAKAIAETPSIPQAVVEKLVTAPETSYEFNLNWSYFDINHSEVWFEAVYRMYKTKPGSLRPGAFRAAKEARPEKFEQKPREIQLTEVEKKQLQRAWKFLQKLGFEIENEVKVVQSLGEYGVTGKARLGEAGGVIWLCRDTFARGTKHLAGTLLEEYLHLEQGLEDCSRELQNWLFDRLMSLGEDLQGEPL